MDLETMISAAREREAQAQQAREREQAEREQRALCNAIERARGLFGADLLELLGVRFEPRDYGAPSLSFVYAGAEYSLCESESRNYSLVRLDPRDEDDERLRPHASFYFLWDDQAGNRDRLLLALADLAAEPALPPLVRREHQGSPPAPPPSAEERLLAALRGYIRDEVAAQWRQWSEY